MTVVTENVIVQASGIAAGVPINYNSPLHSAEEVQVLYGDDEVEAVLNTHYTVILTPPNYNTAQIVPLAALVTLTSTITIIRAQPLTQELSLPTNTRLPEREIEKALDRDVMSLQQVNALLSRVIRLPLTEDDPPVLLVPGPTVRAGTVLGFDEAGGLTLYQPGEGSDGAHPSLPANTIAGNASGITAPLVGLTPTEAKEILEIEIDDLQAIPSQRFLGNHTFVTGPVEAMTPSQARVTLGLTTPDIAGLDAALAGKAALVHTHAIADVIGLQAQIDAILAGVALPTVQFETVALMDADTSQADNTLALVYGEATDGDGGNGIYQWDDPGNDWDFVAEAPFAAVLARLDALEAATLDFRSASAADGDVFIYDGEGVGSGAPQPVTALTQQATAALDMTADAQRIILVSTAVPGTDVTATEVGAVLDIESDYTGNPWFASVGSVLGKAGPYRAFRAEFTLTTVTLLNLGIGFVTQTAAPAVGGAPAQLAADAEGVICRLDGPTLIVYERDGITSAGTTMTVVSTYSTGTPAVQGDVLVAELALNDLGTGGVFRILNNGVLVVQGNVTGIAVDDYVFPVMRFGPVANQHIRVNEFVASKPTIDIPRTFYIWPSAVPGGNGSERNPYMNAQEFLTDDGSDPARGIYKAYMKSGLCFGGIDLSGKKVREFWLRGSSATKCTLVGHVALPAGFAFWTSLGGATPDVWEYTPPSYVSASCGLIDGSTPSVMGPGGGRTADHTHLFRGGFDISAAALQATPGVYSWQVAARKMRVNPGAGVNPNSRDYWLTYTPGIYVRFASADDFNVGKLFIENVDIERCYGGGIILERGFAQIANCHIQAITGNGIQGNESGGQIFGGSVGSTYADNFNNQGGLGTVEKRPQWMIDGVHFWGNPFPTTIGGDTVSNHANHDLIIRSCLIEGSGKSGVGSQGDAVITDSIIRYCYTWGAVTAPQPEPFSKLDVRNTLIHDCPTGISAAVNLPSSSRVDVTNVTFYNMAHSALRYEGTGASEIHAHSWFVRGAAGTAGWSSGGPIIGMSTPHIIG